VNYLSCIPCVIALALAMPCQLTAEEGQAQPSEQAVNDLLEHKSFSEAEAMCRKMLATDPSDKNAAYNLACALARQGRTEDAVSALVQAQHLGFDDADHAQVDSDLVSLHGNAAFLAVIKDMGTQQAADHQKLMQGIPYEAGAPIAGVKIIEGDPASGLRWRLRMGPDATVAKPERLIVWLHPSGASANSMVEALSPELARHGFAFAVFTQKQFMSWQPAEMNKIMPSIQDMAKQPGIDATRPILMGFSAGGQTALLAWSSHPEQWGALLLDAAYPIDIATMHGNHVSSLSVTPAMRAAKVPILALVGGSDGGSQLWQAITPKWVEIGLPITLRVVPGRKHEYLFTGDEWKATLAFLDALPHDAKGAPKPQAAGHDDPTVP
jgi:predicted esterase